MWAFGIAAGIFILAAILYLVVEPVATLLGKHLELPDWRVMLIILVSTGSVVFNLKPRDILALLSPITVRVKDEGKYDQ